MTTTVTEPSTKPRRPQSFKEKDPVRLGVIGSTAIVVLLFLAFNTHGILQSLSTYRLQAVFTEAGGLRSGNDVRLAGHTVGTVTSVRLEGSAVLADLRVERSVRLPSQTRAQVRTATLLGSKFVALIPEGDGELPAGSRIPLSRTKSAYDITLALNQLTRTTQGLDTEQFAQALDEAASTFQRTPREFSATIKGLQELSQSLSSRDGELRQVLARSAELSAELRDRKENVQQLIVDGNLMAAELNNQRLAINQILARVQAAVAQVKALVQDGRQHLTPALKQLNGLLKLVQKNRADLDKLLKMIAPFTRSLSETVASGPFFFVYLANLTPDGFPVFPEE